MLTQFEAAYVEKWTVDYGFAQDIIDVALKKTTSKANPNFDYLDKLLTDWKERGLKSPEEIQEFIKQMKDKNKTVEEWKKKAGYKAYDQRVHNDLDSKYANM